MRPNQLHYVLTLEETITFGKHFFSSATIVESCYGIVHTFFSDDAITNAYHQPLLVNVTSFLWYWLRQIEGEDGTPVSADDEHPGKTSAFTWSRRDF